MKWIVAAFIVYLLAKGRWQTYVDLATVKAKTAAVKQVPATSSGFVSSMTNALAQ